MIDLEQGVESGFAVRPQRVIVAQEKETASFKGLLSQEIKFPLEVSPEFIDCLVHQAHDVEAVEDNVHVGQGLMEGPEIGAAHVHGCGFEPFRFSGKGFQKRADVFFALSFDRVQDSARVEISNHGHIAMALLEAEFINPDGRDLVKGDFAIEAFQPFLVDVFDQVPAHPEIFGNRLDRAEPEHVEHCESKGSNKAVGPHHEGEPRPPERRTSPALQTVESEIQYAFFAADGAHVKTSSLPALETGIPAAAPGASDPLIIDLGAEDDPVGQEMGRSVFNPLQPKSMVK